MQQVKAAVFDSLGESLRGAIFVDLFCAAGGVGIEAISRGARFVHFVENNREALEMLRSNLSACNIGVERAEVHPGDVYDFFAAGDPLHRIVPDVLYADPPYDAEEPFRVLSAIKSLNYPDKCTIILEHRRDAVLERTEFFQRIKLKKFGGSRVSFFVPTGGK